MPSRIVHQNKTIWRSRDFRPVATAASPKNRAGEFVDCASAIPTDSKHSPFRAGDAARDRDEGIVYRIVRYLDPRGGWASTEFWQDRWRVHHRFIVSCVECGILDAAIEEGSQVRRYRCRDESKINNMSGLRAARRFLATKKYDEKQRRALQARRGK